MRKNVLIITSPFRPNIGGVETHLDDLIKEGVSRGITFRVITYQPLVTKAKGEYIEVGVGYKVIRIPWPRFNLFLSLERFPALEFLYLFPGLFIVGFLYLLVKRDFDAIHGQGLVAGSTSLILGKLFKKKVLLSTHSIYNFPHKGLYRNFVYFLFSQCNHILALSKESKKEIEKLGISSSKVTTFTYWVDQKVFKPVNKHKARESLGLSKDAFICLFVGRLIEVKGVRELVVAAKETKDVLFVIIGDGPLEEKIKNQKSKTKNLLFVGRVVNKKLPDYYNASDVLIVPSTHEEGFGRVILESLSCGTPVVGANKGAIPEAVNREVGILIDPTPHAISSALRGLLKNRARLNKMSQKARRFALTRYASKNIEMITRYYNSN